MHRPSRPHRNFSVPDIGVVTQSESDIAEQCTHSSSSAAVHLQHDARRLTAGARLANLGHIMTVRQLWYDFGMKRAVKVAISLPDDLLHRVDRARRERKVSRSEYFRQAATNLLGLTGDEEVDRYVRGYAKHPETPDEVEAARAASARGLAGEPWE